MWINLKGEYTDSAENPRINLDTKVSRYFAIKTSEVTALFSQNLTLKCKFLLHNCISKIKLIFLPNSQTT